MSWVKHLESMVKTIYGYKVLVGKPETKRYFDVAGRIILKILDK
jgi:hypothetical protein